MLLVVFSACGRVRTGRTIPVLTACFLVLAYGILGKGGLFIVILAGLMNELLYPNWNRLCRFTAYRYQFGRLPGPSPNLGFTLVKMNFSLIPITSFCRQSFYSTLYVLTMPHINLHRATICVHLKYVFLPHFSYTSF